MISSIISKIVADAHLKITFWRQLGPKALMEREPCSFRMGLMMPRAQVAGMVPVSGTDPRRL